MAKYMVMMVCFLLLTQDVSAGPPRRQLPSCGDASSESACKNKDSGKENEYCVWINTSLINNHPPRCMRNYSGKDVVVEDYNTVRDLFEEVNQFLEEW